MNELSNLGAKEEFTKLLEELIVPVLVKACKRGDREIRLGNGFNLFNKFIFLFSILLNLKKSSFTTMTSSSGTMIILHYVKKSGTVFILLFPQNSPGFQNISKIERWRKLFWKIEALRKFGLGSKATRQQKKELNTEEANHMFLTTLYNGK